MTFKPKNIHTIYLLHVLGNTLAASFILLAKREKTPSDTIKKYIV